MWIEFGLFRTKFMNLIVSISNDSSRVLFVSCLKKDTNLNGV